MTAQTAAGTVIVLTVGQSTIFAICVWLSTSGTYTTPVVGNGDGRPGVPGEVAR